MNRKATKLLKKYCEKFGEDYKVLESQYKSVPHKGKGIIKEHMRRFNNA